MSIESYTSTSLNRMIEWRLAFLELLKEPITNFKDLCYAKLCTSVRMWVSHLIAMIHQPACWCRLFSLLSSSPSSNIYSHWSFFMSLGEHTSNQADHCINQWLHALHTISPTITGTGGGGTGININARLLMEGIFLWLCPGALLCIIPMGVIVLQQI